MFISISIHAKRITTSLLVTAVILLILGTLARIYYSFNLDNLARGFPILFDLLDMDGEESIPMVFSILLLLTNVLVLFLIAQSIWQSKAKFRWHWLILCIVFLLLAIDEGVSFHERLSGILPILFDFDSESIPIWVIGGAVFVVIFGLLYIPFLVHLPRKTRWMFILAGLIYVSGAIGMEIVGADWAEQFGAEHIYYGLISNLEEFLEMLGLILFIHALLTYPGAMIKRVEMESSLA